MVGLALGPLLGGLLMAAACATPTASLTQASASSSSSFPSAVCDIPRPDDADDSDDEQRSSWALTDTFNQLSIKDHTAIDEARLRFWRKANLARDAFQWTPAALVSEPQPATSPYELSMLALVRATLYALFQTGSAASRFLDDHLQDVMSDCVRVRHALDLVSPDHVPILVRASAVALPAVLARDPDAMTAADVLVRALVALVDRLCRDGPQPDWPPIRAAVVVDADLVVQKWDEHHEPLLFEGGVVRPRTESSVVVVAAQILLAWRRRSAAVDVPLCHHLADQLRHLPPTRLRLRRAFSITAAGTLHVELARRYLLASDVLLAHVRDALARVRRPAYLFLSQLVVLQGVYSDVADLYLYRSGGSAVLDGVLERFLAQVSAPITIRPFLLAALDDDVAEWRRLASSEARAWVATRRRRLQAARYLQRTVEIAAQLLVEFVVRGCDPHRVRVRDRDLPLQAPQAPAWHDGLRDCCGLVGNGDRGLGRRLTYSHVMGSILGPVCPSINLGAPIASTPLG